MSIDGAPTILWVKYMFAGELREVNSAEADIVKILWTGPGMIEIHRQNGVVDSVVSDQMECRAKVDQIAKVITPDKEIALVS